MSPRVCILALITGRAVCLHLSQLALTQILRQELLLLLLLLLSLLLLLFFFFFCNDIINN